MPVLYLVVRWISLSLLIIGVSATQAVAVQNVPKHDLRCSEAFPCTKQLSRRIDFWVEVFGTWDGHTAILHDNDAPWQVYQTISGVDGCSTRKIKRERKRLQANLNALADRLKADLSPIGSIQKKLTHQFDHLHSSKVYKAAKNIRCQMGVKDQFTPALTRFLHYRPMVSKIIKQSGMPEELMYLPFVESSYRPDAYSKVGAAGMWQIMPKTARALGMELNANFDDRLDPEAATRGAMQYFKNAYEKMEPIAKAAKPNIAQSQINPFIVTSYNYGINGMRRAMQKIGPDFNKVLREYKSAAFQVAVKNFYASFLAASHLARAAQNEKPTKMTGEALTYQTFVLPVATSMQRIQYQFDLTDAQLKPLNPSLTRFAWNNWRLIPAGYRLHLPFKEHGWISQIDTLASLNPESSGLGRKVYRVRRGDTACAIANAFRVNCKELITVNQLGRRAVVRIGQQLNIPGKVLKQTAITATKSNRVNSSPYYFVKKGDSACRLAARFDVSCKELIRSNKLSRRATIKIGQRLRIPGRGAELAAVKITPVTLTYHVKKGDTACQIAQKYAVSCARLIADNHLGRKAKIKIGQPLTISGRSSKQPVNVSVNKYIVRKGDTICEIAERFDLPCRQLMQTNNIKKKGKIRVGQSLQIMHVIEPVKIKVVQKTKQNKWLSVVDRLPDMKLYKTTISKDVLRAIVLPDETLAHYADWLGTRAMQALRRLNKLDARGQLILGKTVYLPIKSKGVEDRFVTKRSEFHLVLSEQFKERFTIESVRQYKIRSGQSLWSVANNNQVPLWLLKRFNPKLGNLIHPGAMINLPVITDK